MQWFWLCDRSSHDRKKNKARPNNTKRAFSKDKEYVNQGKVRMKGYPEQITSSRALPAESGRYKITDEIRQSVDDFVKKGSCYLVFTNKYDIVYVIRTDAKNRKPVQSKNIFSVLQVHYQNYTHKLRQVKAALEQAGSDLEKELRQQRWDLGDVHCISEVVRERLLAQLAEQSDKVRCARDALTKLGDVTNYYREEDFYVDSAFVELGALDTNIDKLQENVAAIQTREDLIQARRLDRRRRMHAGDTSILDEPLIPAD
jgi:hypothetical protein